MKRIDDGKKSLVELMSALKFSRADRKRSRAEHITPFAAFKQRARAGYPFSQEDTQLVRSAN